MSGDAPAFSPEDYPDSDPKLLGRLTEEFDELYVDVSSRATVKIASGTFTSAASGVSLLSVKNPLGTKPQHVTLSLRRDDLADFSAAWSWWWLVSGEQISIKFVGLPASIKHAFTIGLL